MPKNIVVFSDGTGQEGGLREEQRLSNVYKLYRVCRVGPDSGIDPRDQVAFYDPGLGTDGSATGFLGAYRRLQKLLSSVTGLGITKNITDCYEFIVNHYEPGDRIYLVGFSRGAYTARCVANVLFLCGVPTTAPDGYLPRFRRATRAIAKEAVLQVYEYGAGSPRAQYEQERFELARRFRHRYGSGDELRSNVAPHFVGVFDTVASLGSTGPLRWGIGAGLALLAALVAAVPAALLDLSFDTGFWGPFVSILALMGAFILLRWLPTAVKTIEKSPVDGKTHRHLAQWRSGNYDRLLSGHVGYARHALAIDETRADFPPVGWGKKGAVREKVGDEPEPLVQMWFAGNHSDIGGSYPEAESRLSDIALGWMVEEATTIPNPLLVDGMVPGEPGNGRLRLHPAADGMQHCEVASMRDTIAGIFPRWLVPRLGRFGWPVKPRTVPPGAPVHPTVYERFEMAEVTQCAGRGAYRPEALASHEDFKAGYVTAAASPDAVRANS
ncbi:MULTISPECIES: DUF2235 domain-containing protein [Methylorubrum]|uniref:DUF2235 domain-containing protein n=1 Tax=Methylorubrum TaxID=2282523 RepID=UPI0020A00D64|nr:MULTISPECIES: DUF2235 domain-containing protein [Methylorubrum]MCP1548422.1 uncharacterized protein (DUF2235 family) [Methylorubrum zatmanii]MCP1554963.1 uncharacterized protein (DUF2235 family) [Methylorubrum extorquens]MCP1578725.1 uncharacterized protein (DUF2235 family) [Methylorubrum extorquens]